MHACLRKCLSLLHFKNIGFWKDQALDFEYSLTCLLSKVSIIICFNHTFCSYTIHCYRHYCNFSACLAAIEGRMVIDAEKMRNFATIWICIPATNSDAFQTLDLKPLFHGCYISIVSTYLRICINKCELKGKSTTSLKTPKPPV